MSFLVTIKNETTDIGDAKFTAKQVICELPHGNTVEILETDEDVAIIMHYHDAEDLCIESILKEVPS
jgi:hypothetical protein